MLRAMRKCAKMSSIRSSEFRATSECVDSFVAALLLWPSFSQTSHRNKTSTMQHSPQVLLIDDNRHGLIARRTLLEEAGYRVETARDGAEGIEKFRTAAFDLVVTDYRTPHAGGAHVLQQVREADPRVPVVIVSGYVKSFGLTEESTGADAVLAKGPTEAQDLLRAVARLLRKKKPGAQRGRARAKSAGAAG
jgi:CheY-like chemotaxis protein